MSLRLADANLKADRCTVMDAVWMSLDRKVVLAAVSRRPGALQYVHDELKADRGIVIAAVSKDGHCLMDAHPTLRADFDVVKIAVSESSNALHWASPQLQADVDLMVAAMRDANRDRLKLRDVRAMIRPLMSDVPHIRQAISLIFPPCRDCLSILGEISKGDWSWGFGKRSQEGLMCWPIPSVIILKPTT